MKVSVEGSKGLERRVKVSLAHEQVDTEAAKRLKELAPGAKISGFRKGKVPAKILKQRHGDSVRLEIVKELLQKTLYEALVQEKLNPAGHPSVDITQNEEGKPFEYIATFDIYPMIKLKDFKKVKLEKPVAEVTEEDIDEALEKLQKQHTEWTDVQRKAQEKDTVEIDFHGRIEGEDIEHGSAEDFSLVLGSGSMIPGFDEAIIGTMPGEKMSMDLEFPKDYHHEEVAGKPVSFDITVHKVKA